MKSGSTQPMKNCNEKCKKKLPPDNELDDQKKQQNSSDETQLTIEKKINVA